MENRYASIEDGENRNPIPPFVNAINSDGDLMAVPNPAYDDARYSEELWKGLVRMSRDIIPRDEYDIPHYGSARQPSTPPTIQYVIGDEIQEFLESRPPTVSPTEDCIEYERRLTDTILQETEKQGTLL